MEDQYLVAMVDEYICYFKNGNLHRENGPAIYDLKNKKEYESLADKDLYKQDMLTITYQILSIKINLKFEPSPHYYLEGKRYDKQAFDSIINNKKIQNELSVELIAPNQTSKSKKVKI